MKKNTPTCFSRTFRNGNGMAAVLEYRKPCHIARHFKSHTEFWGGMGPSREHMQKVMCWQQSTEAQVYAEFPGRLVQNKHRYGCYQPRTSLWRAATTATNSARASVNGGAICPGRYYQYKEFTPLAAGHPHQATQRHFQQRFTVKRCGLLDQNLIGPHVVNRRLTALEYGTFLENELSLYLENVPLAMWGRMWLQHDGMSPHFSREVTKFLKEH